MSVTQNITMRTCIICRKYDSISKFREGKFLYRVCNNCELNQADMSYATSDS